MKAVFNCYATSEHGESPTFFAVDMPLDLIELIESRAKLCVDDIARIVSHFDDGVWESEDVEGDYRLSGGELVITAEHFWFKIYPKHGYGHVETQMQPVSVLRESAATGQAIVFFGDDPENLKEAYEEEQEEV